MVLWYGLSASVFSFWLWMKGIRHVPAQLAGVFTSVLPIAAALYGIVFLGETPGWAHGVALVCVLAGIALASWPGRLARAAAAQRGDSGDSGESRDKAAGIGPVQAPRYNPRPLTGRRHEPRSGRRPARRAAAPAAQRFHASSFVTSHAIPGHPQATPYARTMASNLSPEPQRMRPIPRLIFASRWLQLPLYLGLIVAQGVYVYQFLVELVASGAAPRRPQHRTRPRSC